MFWNIKGQKLIQLYDYLLLQLVCDVMALH